MAKGETYEQFVDKFKPKLTTDDCYTPEAVYEAAKAWAVKRYGWEGRQVVRPFWPGGDYEGFDYPAGCVVIDNPPFSIIAKICRFYRDRSIDYFLFAPHLTCCGITAARSHVCVGASIIYANGANVRTSFVASQGPLVMSSPELLRAVEDANERQKNPLPQYEYPPNVITASRLSVLSRWGVRYEEDRGIFVRALDEQRKVGKSIYGAAYIVPEAPANKAAEEARRNKAAEEGSRCWHLSDREQAALAALGGA